MNIGTGTIVNSGFTTRNKLRTGIEISDKEISQFVVTLIMPLFAFAFNGEFKLKDQYLRRVVRTLIESSKCTFISDYCRRGYTTERRPDVLPACTPLLLG